MLDNLEKCPKCAAEAANDEYPPIRYIDGKLVYATAYTCGSRSWGDGTFTQALGCVHRQLEAANRRVAELERALGGGEHAG